MIYHQYLIVRSGQQENSYGRFAREILKSEGLMGFEVVDLDTDPMPEFKENDIAVFTRCFLRKAEMDYVEKAISSGTLAVVLQPQPSFVERFGLQSQLRVIQPGYVKIRKGYPRSELPIQTHLPIPMWDLSKSEYDWKVIADGVNSNWGESVSPAVIQGRIGKGSIALFFYDLAEAVARIRFGDPDLADFVTNGHWSWPHACDLFTDYLDERLAHLPQADFHGQLLAKVITDICPYPLGRLWYYPKTSHRTAAVFQSDGDTSTLEQFQTLATVLENHEATGTFYLRDNTKLVQSDVETLRARGHTFGPHPHPRARDEELYFAAREALIEETKLFKKRFGDCSQTLQCHHAPWLGYMQWIPAHLENGYRLLFVHLSGPVKLWNTYMCGSGRAMKFFDRNGRLYDCWQQPLVTWDDASLKEKLSNDTESSIREFELRLDAVLKTNHTTISILSHPVSFCTYSSPFMEACFDRLNEEGVPIYNADQWCQFLDRRGKVRISQKTNANGDFEYTISNLCGKIALMIPKKNIKSENIKINGTISEFTSRKCLEEDYIFVQLEGTNEQNEFNVKVSINKF